MADQDYPYPGVNKDELDTPILLIDLDDMEFNINYMAKFFEGSPVRLRPHFKTHKTPIISHKQIAAGAVGVTCQKLGEAEILVASGIKDIMVASQIVGKRKINRLVNLAHHAKITVAVDNADNIKQLSNAAVAVGSILGIIIEVDVGFGRCGVDPGEEIVGLAKLVKSFPGLEFAGIMGYEGHAVFLTDFENRNQTVDQAMTKLTSAAELIRKAGIEVDIVSGGATGTYTLTGRYPGVNEIEAGSYVLMDTRYREIAPEFRCALTMLTTVISVPASDRAVIDAGKKSLSTDFGMPEVINRPGVKVKGLSEEHGILQVDPTLSQLHLGDKVELIPSHVCTTVNLNDYFYGMRGDCLEVIWPIAARGNSQ
jgi:D-serine deaminase-like pyridoxal phosphate-dependent protein